MFKAVLLLHHLPTLHLVKIQKKKKKAIFLFEILKETNLFSNDFFLLLRLFLSMLQDTALVLLLNPLRFHLNHPQE